MERDVGDRVGDDRAEPDVRIGLDDGLEYLLGRSRHGHEQVVGGRAAGSQHLHSADRRERYLSSGVRPACRAMP
jgi:hypothetical protein